MQPNRTSNARGAMGRRGGHRLGWLQVAIRAFLAIIVLVLLWRMTRFPHVAKPENQGAPRYLPHVGVLNKVTEHIEEEKVSVNVQRRVEIPFCDAGQSRPFLVALNTNIDAPKNDGHGNGAYLPLHKPHAHVAKIKKGVLQVVGPVAASASSINEKDVAVLVEGTSSRYRFQAENQGLKDDELPFEGAVLVDAVGAAPAGWHCVTVLKKDPTATDAQCILAQKAFVSVDSGAHKNSELGVTPHQLVAMQHTPIPYQSSFKSSLVSQTVLHKHYTDCNLGALVGLIPATRIEGLPAVAAVLHMPLPYQTSSLVNVFHSSQVQSVLFDSPSDDEDGAKMRGRGGAYDPNDLQLPNKDAINEVASLRAEGTLRTLLTKHTTKALQSVGYGKVPLFDGRGSFWIRSSTPLASSSASISSPDEQAANADDVSDAAQSEVIELPPPMEFKPAHRRHLYTRRRYVNRYRDVVGTVPLGKHNIAETDSELKDAIGGFDALLPHYGQKDIYTLSKGDLRTVESEEALLKLTHDLGMLFEIARLDGNVMDDTASAFIYNPVAIYVTKTITITKSIGLRATLRCSTILFAKDTQLVIEGGVTLALKGMLFQDGAGSYVPRAGRLPGAKSGAERKDSGLIRPVVPLSLTAIGISHGWGGIVLKDKGTLRAEAIIISFTGSSAVQRVAGTGTHIKLAPAITVSPSNSPKQLNFPHKSTTYGSSNTEEAFIKAAADRASLVLMHSAIINCYGPGLGIGKGSMAYITNTLVQDVAQGLECVECSLWVDGTAFTDFPFVSEDFKFADEDNDGIYVRGGLSLINNTVIGNALDDGIDSACNKNDPQESQITIDNTFVFNCQHEGIAISGSQGATRFMHVSHSLVRGCQQGIENGHSPSTHYATIYKSILHANQVGMRYGDDYPLEVSGSIQGDHVLFVDNTVPYLDYVKKEHKEAHHNHFNRQEGAAHGVGSFLWSNPNVDEIGLSSSHTQHGLGICNGCRTYHPPLGSSSNGTTTTKGFVHLMLSGFAAEGIVCGSKALGKSRN